MLARMSVAALVLGAGRGERFRASLGETACAPAKVFAPLAGRSILARSIAALCAVSEIEWVQPVLPAAALKDWDSLRRELAALAAEAGADAALGGRSGREAAQRAQAAQVAQTVPTSRTARAAQVAPPVAGGARRRDSLCAGLAALPPQVSHVAVHDAARPMLRAADAARVVRAALAEGAALLAAPVADTIHQVRGARVAGTPPREQCWAAQTPQVFRRDWLDEALAAAGEAGEAADTDEAALLARLGRPVRVVPGAPENLKITTAADLLAAEAWLRAGGAA